MRVVIILGTRPEIIKMSPIIRELERREADFFILHTGQHYSANLDQVFFEQLKLPQPRYNLRVGSGSHAEETGKMLIGSERVLLEERPDVVLVEGDTNSTLAGALAAAKLHIKVGHIEAGLRSYDRRMPEEINRTLTDHCSDYLFAPTDKSRANLLEEGVSQEKIFVTGNTIVDAVHQNLEIANRNVSSNLECLELNANLSNGEYRTLNLRPREYFLATLHREENVDNQKRFASILEGLSKAAAEFRLPVIYPIHPHSRKRMREFGIRGKNLRLIAPVDFLTFLWLESNARLIFTDSGGVQEESCILGIPCVTLRDNTERPETVEVGANLIAGTVPKRILECAKTMLGRENKWQNPFGDGKAAERIVNLIMEGKCG